VNKQRYGKRRKEIKKGRNEERKKERKEERKKERKREKYVRPLMPII
jgi:hypothetical protein